MLGLQPNLIAEKNRTVETCDCKPLDAAARDHMQGHTGRFTLGDGDPITSLAVCALCQANPHIGVLCVCDIASVRPALSEGLPLPAAPPPPSVVSDGVLETSVFLSQAKRLNKAVQRGFFLNIRRPGMYLRRVDCSSRVYSRPAPHVDLSGILDQRLSLFPPYQRVRQFHPSALLARLSCPLDFLAAISLVSASGSFQRL